VGDVEYRAEEVIMRFVQVLLSGWLVVVLVACGGGRGPFSSTDSAPRDNNAGAREIDPIVGTWLFVKSSDNRDPAILGTTLEFMKNGKVRMRGPGYANEGTYSTDGGVLTVNVATGAEKFTIAKLTDKELVLELRSPPFRTDTWEYKKK
jgi:hypothetical protein